MCLTYLGTREDEEQYYDGLDLAIERDEYADEAIGRALVKGVTELYLCQ